MGDPKTPDAIMGPGLCASKETRCSKAAARKLSTISRLSQGLVRDHRVGVGVIDLRRCNNDLVRFRPFDRHGSGYQRPGDRLVDGGNGDDFQPVLDALGNVSEVLLVLDRKSVV